MPDLRDQTGAVPGLEDRLARLQKRALRTRDGRGMTPVTEADIAAVVVTWLQDLGADVYQEVELHRVAGAGRADIVARVRSELWIVETKTSMSLSLIEQAMHRRRYAHRVYVAAPRGRAGNSLCTELGIGLLEVHHGSDDGHSEHRVRVMNESRRWNQKPVSLAGRLHEEQKTCCAAGSPAGGHWTPFRGTCQALQRTVAQAGIDGIAVKAAIGTSYHYSSLRAERTCLVKWVRDGRLPGVVLRDGKFYAEAA